MKDHKNRIWCWWFLIWYPLLCAKLFISNIKSHTVFTQHLHHMGNAASSLHTLPLKQVGKKTGWYKHCKLYFNIFNTQHRHKMQSTTTTKIVFKKPAVNSKSVHDNKLRNFFFYFLRFLVLLWWMLLEESGQKFTRVITNSKIYVEILHTVHCVPCWVSSFSMQSPWKVKHLSKHNKSYDMSTL